MSKIILKFGLEGENLGKISIEGDGFTGMECIHTIDELQALLGLNTEAQVDKPELVKQVTTEGIYEH